MDGQNNGNRFFLNIHNERTMYNDRTYPTTPSTFPNPIMSPGVNQGQPQNLQQQPYQAGLAPSGYFMNSPYTQNFNQQPPSPGYQQSQQTHLNSYQQRPALGVNTDTTNGLVHQFSHQNLGGRTNPHVSNQQVSSPRPRTAGGPGQGHSCYGGYMNMQVPNMAQQNLPEFRPAPERNPDKYGQITQTNQKRCSQMAEAFFKDSVKRARDRNVRWVSCMLAIRNM